MNDYEFKKMQEKWEADVEAYLDRLEDQAAEYDEESEGDE